MSSAQLLKPIMSGIVAPPPVAPIDFGGAFGSPFDYAFKKLSIPDPIRIEQSGSIGAGDISIPSSQQPKGPGKPPQEEQPQQPPEQVVPQGSTTIDPFGIKEIRGGGGGGSQTIPMNFMSAPGSPIPGAAPLDPSNPIIGAIGSAMGGNAMGAIGAGPAMDMGMGMGMGMGGNALGLPMTGLVGANLPALAAMGIHGLGAGGAD